MDQSKVRRRLKIGLSLPVAYIQALARYNWQFLEIGKRFSLALREHYLPGEAFECGLLNPALPASMIKGSISRSRLVAVQRKVNPMAWESALYNKGVFYHICLAAGLPVPALYAVIPRKVRGWTSFGRMPRTSVEWEEFFVRDCPQSFVIKPCRSEYGVGLFFAERQGDRFLLNDGTSLTSRELVGKILDNPEFDSYVIQERIHNSPELAPLGEVRGVHSFRVVTLIGDDGEARVVAADMKIITGDNVASNLAHGSRGNYIADIDRDTGCLRTVLAIDIRNGGYKKLSHHPETGADLEGLRIPQWGCITALAKKAAAVFSPVGTIGWDIALRETGPCIMEGNIWYSPSLTGYLRDYWAISYE